MIMKIPAKIRLKRIWSDIKRKIPFIKTPSFTPEGEAFLIHIKNLYRGNYPHSESSRDIVDKIKKQFTIENDDEAIEILFMNFYAVGLVDEVDLFEIKQIALEKKGIRHGL